MTHDPNHNPRLSWKGGLVIAAYFFVFMPALGYIAVLLTGHFLPGFGVAASFLWSFVEFAQRRFPPRASAERASKPES